jgi:high-affinity iron transporter
LAVVLGLGIGSAFVTFWLLQKGGRALSWRWFFRISEILLLLLAGGLLVTGIEKLIGLDVLPPLADQLWDTSAVLDDTGRFGGFVAAMTGYRAQPSLLPLLCLAVFWIAILYFLRDRRRPR